MTVEIPGYRIVRVLGKGGMATVYLAVQHIFERQVALKVMSTTLAEDPSFGQRFLREARIVSQLVHPNIITVYDVGVHENAYYLSMEYVAGPDLKQAREQLTLAQKIQIILDIAKALDFAGKKGYVHRDIKPENILLRHDSYGAVLMDFGIARAAEADLTVTQTGMALGTPHYMSPEQAKGQAVDHRSDLYSLGVVFYYLLTGSVPYHADSAVAIGIKHITEPVPALPEFLQSLQKFIDRLMAKLPEDRYQAAAELVADLHRVDVKAIEVEQADFQRGQLMQPQSDPDAKTQIHRNVDPITPATTTHITRLTRVKDLFWQYKLVAGAALVVIFAAFVIVNRPEDSPRKLPATPETAEAKPDANRAKVTTKKRAPADEELDSEPDAPGAPAYISGPVKDIRLSDLAGPEYRQMEEPPARTRPGELVQRLQRRLQEVSGRAPVRELTLSEKVAELRTAMQRDSRDLEPQKRLASLASEYFKKAQQFFNEGDFASAQRALNTGKTLFPEYKPLHNDLAARLKNRDRLERLLSQAKVRLEEERLTSPWRNNALHYYRGALKIDPDLVVAQRGVKEVESALLRQARSHFSAGNWAEAADLAEDVLDIRPGHEEARQFLLKLEQHRRGGGDTEVVPASVTPPDTSRSVSLREGAPVETAGPRIHQLRVDGKLLSGMNARQLQAIDSQRTLFISFEYEDFPGDKQLLQAELLSSGKSVFTMSVPVTEKKGLHRFRMERPRQPFPVGEYELRLSLGRTVLLAANFLIE